MAIVREERAARDCVSIDAEFLLQNHAHAIAGEVGTARSGEDQTGNSLDEWGQYSGELLHQLSCAYPCRRLLAYFAERVNIAQPTLLFRVSCQHLGHNGLRLEKQLQPNRVAEKRAKT